jgi:16S rRNA (cytosine967-C5)-methyltransferase
MADPRVLALAALRRVERDQAFLNLALDAELAAAGALDPRDAALATELAYGTMRRRALLDRALSPLVKGGLGKLEAAVLDLLRLGAYQLLFTRVPPHAAVGETVSAAKAAGLSRAAGLCNAVLRRLAREGAPPPPDRAADPLAALEVEASLPRWLASRVLARLGAEEAFRFAAAMDRPAPPTVRVNRTRLTREQLAERLAVEAPGATLSPGVFAPGALTVDRGGSLPRLPAFGDGLFSLQDEAAQLVGHLAAPAPGARVLDACAAPGGKACHLAELGAREVVALDVNPRKARRIGEEAARLGLAAVKPLAADAGTPLPPEARGPFDLVLVDAPCSGTGTLRRHPELRYRRCEEELPRLCATQAAILDNVAPEVRVGGTLVYAVCSVLAEEGPEQFAAFLARHGDAFAPAPLDPPPAWTADGATLETWPQRHGLDGFWAGRLVRRR